MVSRSKGLKEWKITIPNTFIERQIRQRGDGALGGLDLYFREQHCVVSGESKKGSIAYRWAASAALRDAAFDGRKRYVKLEPHSSLRVIPTSQRAQRLQSVPESVGIDISILVEKVLQWTIQSMIDRFADRIFDSATGDLSDEEGLIRDGELWCYSLPEGAAKGNPLLATVDLPVIGERSLLGDVILLKRLDLCGDDIEARLVVNPHIVRAVTWSSVWSLRGKLDPTDDKWSEALSQQEVKNPSAFVEDFDGTLTIDLRLGEER